MSSDNREPSKIGGDAKYYQGVAKETAGKVLGNEQMQAEGTAKKMEGKYESDAAKGNTQNQKHQVIGGAKETLGNAIGNEQLQAEGRELSLQYTGLATFKPFFDRMEGVLIPPGSSSAFTGICTGVLQASTLVTPLELIKVRQQTDLNKQRYRSMSSTIVHIVKDEGVLALYKGLLPTIFRQSWGLAFTGYISFKDLFSSLNNGQNTPLQHALSGFLANILVGIFNSPPDVVKTRMQDQNAGYRNSFECVKSMLKNEGVKSFFKGATLRCVRIAPGGAIQFSTYEYLNKLIGDYME
ncbi:25250_t:CDS:2, partial [Dentiscutata erythropus]